jgi:hypothetical protein
MTWGETAARMFEVNMNDDKKNAVSPSRPLMGSTARRIRATVFLSEAEANLLFEFAFGTNSGNDELNLLCERIAEMARKCRNKHRSA